jgi:hypothetical protein
MMRCSEGLKIESLGRIIYVDSPTDMARGWRGRDVDDGWRQRGWRQPIKNTVSIDISQDMTLIRLTIGILAPDIELEIVVSMCFIVRTINYLGFVCYHRKFEGLSQHRERSE